MATRLSLSSVCVAALAGILVLPSAALAEGQGEEHRSDQAASHQPTSRPSAQPTTSQGDEHRADPAAPPRATGKPTSRPASADPKGRKGGSKGSGATGSDNGDPAGNNGTIKIDYPIGDSGHANRPHPGCGFQLRMFNFDDDQYGQVTITGQAPTSTGTLLSRRLLLSDDAAGGGQDVDSVYAFTTADLGLTAIPPAAQGWHLKVAVDAENAPGGAKQKVFWLDCAGTDTAAAPRGQVNRLPVGETAAATPVSPRTITAELSYEAASAVNPKPFSFTGGGGGFLRGAALPMTGVELPLLLLAAATSLGVGALAVRAGRRRTPVA